MRNELARKAEKKRVLSENQKLKTQNSEPRTQNLRVRLPPAEEIKREMAPDSLEIGFVTGYERRADAARGQGNQDIEGQLPKLVCLVMPTSLHDIQQLAGMDPMCFSGRDHLTSMHQIHHESTFKPRPRATQQLMHHNSRAANHVGRLKKTKGETTSSEVIDID